MEHLLYERKGHVGLLTINRPKALNALNGAVISELRALLDELKATDIRCLVITGAGEKAFVAGADIAEMKDMTPEQAAEFSRAGNAVMDAVENFPTPVVAAVNGYALGGGCELALSCDIRIASAGAVFSFPEVSLGIMPGYGGIQRAVRLIGIARAKEMVYTARRIKAEKAAEIGLVNSVCAPEELMTQAMELADAIAANAPVGVRSAKTVANRTPGLTLEQSAGLEVDCFADCFRTQDMRMAMTAFVEKRKPDPFEGT